VSDRDPKFTGAFWRELFRLLGTQLKMSSSHHPQTDGQTERLNATLEQLLRIYVTSAAPNWSDHLPDIQFVYNSSRQSATQASPFLVLYGFEPSTPSRLVAASTSTEDALAPAAGSLCDATAARHRLIADRLAEAQATMAFYADKSRRPVEFKVFSCQLNTFDTIQTPSAPAANSARYFAGRMSSPSALAAPPTAYSCQPARNSTTFSTFPSYACTPPHYHPKFPSTALLPSHRPMPPLRSTT
jgi:hypothetical protein